MLALQCLTCAAPVLHNSVRAVDPPTIDIESFLLLSEKGKGGKSSKRGNPFLPPALVSSKAPDCVCNVSRPSVSIPPPYGCAKLQPLNGRRFGVNNGDKVKDSSLRSLCVNGLYEVRSRCGDWGQRVTI